MRSLQKKKKKTGQQNQGGSADGPDQNHVSGAVPRGPGEGVSGCQGWQKKRRDVEKHGSGMVWQPVVLESFTRSAVLWCHLLVSRCKASSGSHCH